MTDGVLVGVDVGVDVGVGVGVADTPGCGDVDDGVGVILGAGLVEVGVILGAGLVGVGVGMPSGGHISYT